MSNSSSAISTVKAITIWRATISAMCFASRSQGSGNPAAVCGVCQTPRSSPRGRTTWCDSRSVAAPPAGAACRTPIRSSSSRRSFEADLDVAGPANRWKRSISIRLPRCGNSARCYELVGDLPAAAARTHEQVARSGDCGVDRAFERCEDAAVSPGPGHGAQEDRWIWRPLDDMDGKWRDVAMNELKASSMISSLTAVNWTTHVAARHCANSALVDRAMRGRAEPGFDHPEQLRGSAFALGRRSGHRARRAASGSGWNFDQPLDVDATTGGFALLRRPVRSWPPCRFASTGWPRGRSLAQRPSSSAPTICFAPIASM